MAFTVRQDGSLGNEKSPAIGSAASQMPYFDMPAAIPGVDLYTGKNDKAKISTSASSLQAFTAADQLGDENDTNLYLRSSREGLDDIGSMTGGDTSVRHPNATTSAVDPNSADGSRPARLAAAAASSNSGDEEHSADSRVSSVPLVKKSPETECRLAVSFDFPNGKQLHGGNGADAARSRSSLAMKESVSTAEGSPSLDSSSVSDGKEGTPADDQDNNKVIDSHGLNLSSATTLERAIIRHLGSSSEPLLLTSLASMPELRSLAISEGKELRKPYFVERPHLFRCVQEDRFTTRIAIAQPSEERDSTVVTGQSSPVPITQAPEAVESTSSSLSSSAEFTSFHVAKSGRQAALQQLEEDVTEFIRMSEQRTVFLGRFGAMQSLKRLAQRAGVELKKPFFTERPHLFRCIQEASGTINVILAEDAKQQKGSSDLSGDVWSSGEEDGAGDSEDEEEYDDSESSDAAGEGDRKSFGTGRAQGEQTHWQATAPSSMRLVQEMENAAVAFVYQSVGRGKVLLALFGQNRHLKKLAIQANIPWRKVFFTDRPHFFKCISQGVTALSVQLTDAGYNRAQHLYQGGFSIPLSPGLGENPTSEHQPLSAIQRLERSLVKFLQEQPNQTSFLHVPAADPKLQRLANAAGEVLRKPFYESRPHLFQVKYTEKTTVVVSLVQDAAQSLRPNYHRLADQKRGEGKVSTNVAEQLLENAIADYLLASQQENVYLSQLASDLRLQEMAQAANVHINKAFFVERPKLFTINQIGTQASKLVVGLNLGKIASSPSSKTPMSLVPLPSGPGFRRLENAAVSVLVQFGQPVPISRICDDRMLISLSDRAATLNTAFFKNRPHLFHVHSEGEVTMVGLPMSIGNLKTLEEAVKQVLLNFEGKVELGIVGNDKHLGALAAKVAPGAQITKSFFLARPHQFRVIQRGSRAEVALVRELRGLSANPAGKPAPKAAAPPSSLGKVMKSGPPTQSAALPVSETSIDALDDWSSVTRWEDLYQLTREAVSKADQGDSKASHDASALSGLPAFSTSASSSELTTTATTHRSAAVPVNTKLATTAEITPLQWTSTDSASQSGYGNNGAADPSYYDPTFQSSVSVNTGSPWSGYENSDLLSSSSVAPTSVETTPGWSGYNWYGSSSTQPNANGSSTRLAYESTNSAKVLPPLTEKELDVAERQLLSMAPSLAYTLRLHRMNTLDSMLESLQLDRLRAELLQLQLSRGQPVLTMQETYHTAADGNNSLEQAYQIDVVLGGECVGRGKGSWKAAKIGAMVEAAARLSQP